jgi:hypothetical protein
MKGLSTLRLTSAVAESRTHEETERIGCRPTHSQRLAVAPCPGSTIGTTITPGGNSEPGTESEEDWRLLTGGCREDCATFLSLRTARKRKAF